MPATLSDAILFDPVSTPLDGEPCTATTAVGDGHVQIEEALQVLANRDASLMSLVSSVRTDRLVQCLNGTDLVVSGALRSALGVGSTATAATYGFSCTYVQAAPMADQWRYLFLQPESTNPVPVVSQTELPIVGVWGTTSSVIDRSKVLLASYFARASGGVRPFRRCGSETLYDLCSVNPTTLRPVDLSAVVADVTWANVDLRSYVPPNATHVLLRLSLTRTGGTSTGSSVDLAVRDAAGSGDALAYRVSLWRDNNASHGIERELWVPVNPATPAAGIQYAIAFAGAAVALDAYVQVLGYREQ